MKGNYSGPNIAVLAFKVIEEYGIEPKVGFYMLDSATNNDTMIVELYNMLIANYGWKASLISPDDARLRCFGHVLNLAVKALLFGTDTEAFEYNGEGRLDAEAEETEFTK